MSRQVINQYYSKLDRIIQYGGSRNEGTIRTAFQILVNDYANRKNLELVTEVAIKGTKGANVKPDGVLKNALRLDFGYWESKDESDDIEEEIDKKLKRGYPLSNALFEDSQTAILYQNAEEVLRVHIKDPKELDRILNAFVNFEKPEIREFNEAIVKFQEDLPTIIEHLRKQIDDEGKKNETFMAARQKFLEHCQTEINPEISMNDIREMIIQHVATSDIFNNIFNDPDFHRQNNIALQIDQLVEIVFTRSVRKNMLDSLQSYYGTIKEASSSIADHHEKQKFLKVLYENFYKAYNPKGADRLGVVYTPNEIVHFMIEGTEFLLEKYFNKALSDRNVEILDPATGTGTFITDLIEYIPKQNLVHKFKEEIHANEVAILPYYIANLNIEYTFKQKMGYYEEYKNICFVDTLDNTDALSYKGKQSNLFGFSTENAERIQRQNSKRISVIIGNPPYNANQQNESDNNKNRDYYFDYHRKTGGVDGRIKDTFIKHSTAQKTKVYDMYARFYRWAMDRIDKNGIIAFITNRSFIESRTFDGFRKCVMDEFSHAYVVDTKSDVRANPTIAGTTHNVFGIQTGVAIMFLVRKEDHEGPCRIEYVAMDDFWRKEEKLAWLKENRLRDIQFELVVPDRNNNWLNLVENDFDSLLPLIDKDVKLGRRKEAIFELFTLGTVSNRDEWVYDRSINSLKKKINYFITTYNNNVDHLPGVLDMDNTETYLADSIKYTRDLKKRLFSREEIEVKTEEFRICHYRVFTKLHLYYAAELNEMRYQTPLIFPTKDSKNILIAVNQGSKPFNVLCSDILVDLHFNGDSQCLPFYRYKEDGSYVDNITDWSLEHFRVHYKNSKITKEAIFSYVYAVLHSPSYVRKYEINLKRELPRVPLYPDFKFWSKIGRKLIDLHIGYENVKPYPLKEISSSSKGDHKKEMAKLFESKEPEPLYSHKPRVKCKLKASKTEGVIEIDELTILTGIPIEAWEYKLGNRSALEWVLDQHKEKKVGDATITEKFDSYQFADYKTHVINLLKKVCTVSVETMKIIREMETKVP